MKRYNSERPQDVQYRHIISRLEAKAEEYSRRLGYLPKRLQEMPYSRRSSAQIATMMKRAETLTNNKEKDSIIAYYARPDVQREIYRYAYGRHVTVLRNFKPMFNALYEPEDVLPLMIHYLNGNRWPSLHGTILRYNEAGKRICDYVFEPDFKKSWTVAFSAARPVVQLFLKIGLPFFIKFSGSTSPHIIVPGEALASAGEEEISSRDFREQVYRFVQSRMDKPGLLDGANWQPDHYLRLVYSIHELGGKVSVPIMPEKFDSFNPNNAKIENAVVIENWWHIPDNAAERGKEFVQQVTRNYPGLVRGISKTVSIHEWKPPEVPRKVRQVIDAGRYTKMLAHGQWLITDKIEDTAITKALDMLKRREGAGLEVDFQAAGDVFGVDVDELRRLYSSRTDDVNKYYLRGEIQEVFYSYSTGRFFRSPAPKEHFRLQKLSDIPMLAEHFKASDADWRGFECTRAIYAPVDNQIIACDIGIEIDFSRSDYTSAVELAQILAAALRKHEIFYFIKFDGNEILEIVIPSASMPKQIDGNETALQMPKIVSGLNRGFRRIPEVDGNDCRLNIQPYGYTMPAYSLNPATGLACIILMPDDLPGFDPEHAKPERVSVNKLWLDIPANAPLQAQRFLKYVLSPDWQPVID